AVLGAAAGPQAAKRVTGGVEACLFVGVLLIAIASLAAVRWGSDITTAVVSGLSFGGGAVAARALQSRTGLVGFVGQPLTLALVAYGVLGLVVYAYALEHGDVGSVTAAMWVSDIMAAGGVGIVLLGDRARPGWWAPAVVATLGAVASIVVLGRSPAQATPIGLEADLPHRGPHFLPRTAAATAEPPAAVAKPAAAAEPTAAVAEVGAAAEPAAGVAEPGAAAEPAAGLVSATLAPSGVPPPRRRLPRSVRWALQIVPLLIAVGVGAYVLSARRTELVGAAAALHHLRWPWLAVAASAELASIVAYAALQGRILASGGVDVGMPSLTGIALAGYAIQNSLPAGPAWSGLFAFRQFRRRGADPVVAGWTMVIVPLVSGACLVGLAVMGTVLAQGQASSLGLIYVVVGVAVLAIGMIFGLRRWAAHGAVTAAAIRLLSAWQHLFRRPGRDMRELVETTRHRLVAVTPHRRDWAAATGWAVANWGLDCVCLMLAFFALAAPVPWRGLLLAYGAGQLAANLPITPGGLGAVEGSLTVALVFYGGGRVSTVAAVLLYRIISFWALLPLGWASWLVLRWIARGDGEGTGS
ncbi:MAG: YbhN family protein, partial [Actinobacteria bacterium]|nr:YbhN family protein [Actinomycetota bacterium]